MSLIKYPMSKNQPLPGILDPISIQTFRGVNTYEPLTIDESYFTDMSNLTTDDYPAISTCPGYSVLGAAIGTSVLGMGIWKDTEIHAVFNDGTWRKWTGTAWSAALVSGLNTTAHWSFTNFQGNLTDINLIGSNGVDAIKCYDGATVSNLAGAPVGNFITTYQNRLWCAVGKELKSCALDQPTQWALFGGTDEDSYSKDLESIRGENINMLSGSLSKLTIGFPNGIQVLYGNVPSNFYTSTITEKQGVTNNQSITVLDGVIRYIHKDGIFEYGGASLPDRGFSDIVSSYFSVTNNVAGSDGTKLYFNLGTNLLVYDPRSGIQAWSVWNHISPTSFAVMAGEYYIGDTAGRVLKLTGSTAAGATISWYGVTKPFWIGSMARKQKWYKLWIVADVSPGSTMQVFLSPSASSNTDWVEVTTYIQGSRIIIPISVIANANYVRIKVTGTGPVKIHEISRQIRAMPLY